VQVRDLVEALRRRAVGRFDRVDHAFLQFAEPTFAEALERCVAAGATRVVVLPFLLSPGSHVDQDIPALVEEARRRHPALEIETVPYVGASPSMPELLLDLAENG